MTATRRTITVSRPCRTNRLAKVSENQNQLAFPLELPGSAYRPAARVAQKQVSGGKNVAPPKAQQEAGERRAMVEDDLKPLLDRLAKLSRVADATSEEAQELMVTRNRLVVAASRAGASRGQIARLIGVSDGTVIDILDRAKKQ